MGSRDVASTCRSIPRPPARSTAVTSVSFPAFTPSIISRRCPRPRRSFFTAPPNRQSVTLTAADLSWPAPSDKTAPLFPSYPLRQTARPTTRSSLLPPADHRSRESVHGRARWSMKVLCSACEAAEAHVLCCADKAALCERCDRDVHAANRLAGKHHRLPLLAPGAITAPNCDICQECHAYFFCVEDRALLCRSCDVAVHTANAFVSAHRRFLLTGVQVGLQPDAQETEQHTPTASTAAAAASLQTPPPPPPAKKRSSPAPLYSDDDIDWVAGPDGGLSGNLPDWCVVDEQFNAPVQKSVDPVATKPPAKRSPWGAIVSAYGGQGGVTGGMQAWPLDEFFGFSEFNAGLGLTENSTSKADSGKLGSTDGSPNGWSSSDIAQDFFGQVPEVHPQWSVPELPSPPTASGLHWQGGPRHDRSATTDAAAMSVPDISSPGNPFLCFAADTGQPLTAPPAKRRRY